MSGAGIKSIRSRRRMAENPPCEEINLKELTCDDAQADGFASLSKLLTAELGESIRIPKRMAGTGTGWSFGQRPPNPHPQAKGLPSPQMLPEKHLARQIRADLDKAVRQSGSLFSL